MYMYTLFGSTNQEDDDTYFTLLKKQRTYYYQVMYVHVHVLFYLCQYTYTFLNLLHTL